MVNCYTGFPAANVISTTDEATTGLQDGVFYMKSQGRLSEMQDRHTVNHAYLTQHPGCGSKTRLSYQPG